MLVISPFHKPVKLPENCQNDITRKYTNMLFTQANDVLAFTGKSIVHQLQNTSKFFDVSHRKEPLNTVPLSLFARRRALRCSEQAFEFSEISEMKER